MSKQQIDWPMEMDRRNRELAAMTEERDSLQQVFDLQWEADMRAVKRWRAANPGNELVLPDRANLVVFLLEELDHQAVRSDQQLIRENCTYLIEHDGFEGTEIGSYVTREGKEGVVLQQIGTRVVHVYGRRWLNKLRISDDAHAAGRTKAGNDIGSI